jgi:hypothetical protein
MMLQTEERRATRGRRAEDFKREQELSMLRAEIEILMLEREHLLRTAGAAAMFVAKLDSQVLPESTYEAADILAGVINTLPEETLKDAVESVRKTYGETLGAASANQ